MQNKDPAENKSNQHRIEKAQLNCPYGDHKFDADDPFNIGSATEFGKSSYKLCRHCKTVGIHSVKITPHAPTVNFYYRINESGQIVYEEAEDGKQRVWVKHTPKGKLAFTELLDLKKLELSFTESGSDIASKITRIEKSYDNILRKLIALPEYLELDSIQDGELLEILLKIYPLSP